jgi:hypothetical protein
MIVGKVRSMTLSEHLKGASLGEAVVLLAKIRLGLERLASETHSSLANTFKNCRGNFFDIMSWSQGSSSNVLNNPPCF